MHRRLNLAEMHKRHRALTPPISASYEEAARVCLSRHHQPPVQITLADNSVEDTAEVTWAIPDSRTLGAWANNIDTTEAGAYACVIAAVEELRGLLAVRRAETGTGADYYVGPPNVSSEDLENCIRLEISGVDAGDRRAIMRRLREKVQQARDGHSSLPAVAGVIGFLSQWLMVEDVPEKP